ncbi:MAG: nucleotidyltransferase domain-containing protein [Chloroflexi bacterium]|nr:MAG: nucleotidyltransferase domain-containing protein [Chloroflexota bacterium]
MERQSSSLSGATWRDYPHRSSVERFVERVRSLRPLLVLLFGSVATGDFTQHSDADVLVVFDHPVDWVTVYACSDGIVQPIVKTWQELTDQITAGEPFFCEIVEEGVVLFDDDDWYAQLRRHVAAARERWGLERTPDGWRWTAA